MSFVKTLKYLSMGICTVTAIVTIVVYALFVVWSHGTAWGYSLFFGTWNTLVYTGLFFACRYLSFRVVASSILFLGTLLICGFGLFVLPLVYGNTIRFYMDPGGMNCAGPILEVGVPLVQFTALMMVVSSALIAAFFGKSNRRKIDL